MRFVVVLALAAVYSCTDDQLPKRSAQGLPKASGGTAGASDYCRGAIRCISGEGDCDSDAECEPPLVCNRNNGPRFGLPSNFDVCVPAHCGDGCGGECGSCTPSCPMIVSGRAGSCTSACPCAAGEGDCDSDAQCAPGLICGHNNGANFGLPPKFDVCISTQPEIPVRMVGAGDIATCGGNQNDQATAQLLDEYFATQTDGIVFTAGDNAYSSGTALQFMNCYHPTWGRHLSRTRPAAGNHDYVTPGAAGYFGYFGAAAGDPAEGWYSYDHGAWHIVVLNTNCAAIGGCNAGSAQELWLRADLAANPRLCTLAIGHHPRYSSGEHGNIPAMADLWTALHEGGVDLLIVGHDHDYERFAPMNASGALDPLNGMRQIVVGTGGRLLDTFDVIVANSEVRNDVTYGVLALELFSNRYSWQFIPIAGSTFTDSGTTNCH